MPAAKKYFGFLVTAVAVVAGGLTPTHANAQTLQLQGWTNGCFGTGCVLPNTSAFQTATMLNLKYINSTINTTVQNGGTAILNGPGKFNQQNFNNFGSLVGLSGGGTTNWNNVDFSLGLTLTDPTSTTVVFAGVLNGTITNNGSLNNLTLAFANMPANISFTNGNGFAVITISGLGGNNGSADAYAISGVIRTHVTPEPMTMVLLGTGLMGVGGALRRRRKITAEPA